MGGGVRGATRAGRGAAEWLIAEDRGGYVRSREAYFAAVRERYGLTDSAAQLCDALRHRMPELVRCRPEVLRGLAALRAAGWRVGIVTNGAAGNQLAKIERTGLSDVVDAWCVSGEAGIRKPDVRIFRLAARRCGSDPDAGGWMVGDNPANDIAGGRAAGLRTVWVGRPADWPAGEPAADRVVPDASAAIRALSVPLLLERFDDAASARSRWREAAEIRRTGAAAGHTGQGGCAAL